MEGQPPKENKEKLQKKILFADDEKSIRFGLAILLKSDGYEVVEVESGQELLDKLTSGEKFDIVLTDNRMNTDDPATQIDGLQALERIRSNKDLKNLPVIVMSADPIEEEVKKFGGVYMSKPFDIDVIQKKIKEMTE